MNDTAEPTLYDLIADLWKGRFAILAGAVAGAVLCFGWLAAAVPQYRAAMLIAPASQTTGSDIAALLGQYDLPSLQYIIKRPGSAEANDFVRFENTLTGPSVAAVLFEDEKIRRAVAAHASFAFQKPQPLENSVALWEYLAKQVKILPVGSTALRSVEYKHPDPAFAAYLLQRLHKVTDDMIRADINEVTEDRITYVHKALAETHHPDHQRALTGVLMEQEQVRMMVAMDKPFAAAIIEPPASGTKPAWPRPMLTMPVAALIGGFFGFLLYGLRRVR